MNLPQLTGSELAITNNNGVIHALGYPVRLSFLNNDFNGMGDILSSGGGGNKGVGKKKKQHHKKNGHRKEYDGMSVPAGLTCTSHYDIMYTFDNGDNGDNYNDTPVIGDELYDTLLRLSEYKKDNHPHVLYDNAELSQSPNNYDYYYVDYDKNVDKNVDKNKTKKKQQTKHVKSPKRNTKKIKNKNKK